MPIRRTRRTLLILGACWIALSTAWIACRWWAVHILETSPGVVCTWKLPTWTTHRWSKLLPTSRVTDLKIGGRVDHPAKLLWAMRRCGPIDSLLIDPDAMPGWSEPSASLAFLTSLGPQPRVRSLHLAGLSLDDQQAAAVLHQFPGLQKLSLHWVQYSGEHFPTLPTLQDVEIYFTPISDSGLAAVLRSPSLRTCKLAYTRVSLDGLRQMPQWKQKALIQFTCTFRELPKDELEILRQTIQLACPEVQTTISAESIR
jgi:hypothetical protein